jgi:hypothetical protein
MIIAIHVDDFLVATREVHFQWLVKAMEQWYSITYHKADLCLGIKIERDGSGGYNISQQHYLEELLKELNMQDCKPSTTPMSKGAMPSRREIQEARNLTRTVISCTTRS